MSKIVRQYRIYELDKNHGLAKKERSWNETSNRIILVEPEGYNLRDNFNSMEEVLNAISEHGEKYVEYTIVPQIYLRDE